MKMKGFTFNKVYVIESLNGAKEKLTGEELYNDLLRWKKNQHKDLKTELIQVEDKSEFHKKIDFIKKECATKGKKPIIHFEIHGSNDKTGLILNSGEIIKWSELYNDLIDINSIIGNNLFLTMAVCHGAYIMKLIQPYRSCPFWGFIGSFESIEVADLMIRYNSFYDEFLKEFSLDNALKRLHESNPGIPSSYKFINAELTFRDIIRNYFKKKFTESEIKKSFNKSLKQNNIKIGDRNAKHELERKFKVGLLRSKKSYFEKHKRIFFMYDNFPANKEIFEVDFEELNDTTSL